MLGLFFTCLQHVRDEKETRVQTPSPAVLADSHKQLARLTEEVRETPMEDQIGYLLRSQPTFSRGLALGTFTWVTGDHRNPISFSGGQWKEMM